MKGGLLKYANDKTQLIFGPLLGIDHCVLTLLHPGIRNLSVKQVCYHLLCSQRTLELPARFCVRFDAELTLGQLQAAASCCLNHVLGSRSTIISAWTEGRRC